MIAAATGASRFLIRDFGEMENLQSSADSGLRFATNGRTKVEKIIIESLKAARPKFGIMTPNETVAGSDISHRFVINAIDGFDNFARAMPFFAISIALMEQKETIAAVIYSPILDKLFYASRGEGAFVIEARMKRRIRTSRKTSPAKIYGQNVALGCGSLGAAYIANGSIDAGIFSATSMFDLAAASIIVKEAGGLLTAIDAEGKPAKDFFGAHRMIIENNHLQPSLNESIIAKK